MHFMHYNFVRIHQTLRSTPTIRLASPITSGRWMKWSGCWIGQAMREFFGGWRRKLGCVALVVSCVFAGLFMRSFAFDFGIAGDTYVESSQGYLRWTKYSQFAGEHTPQPLRWFSHPYTGMNGNQFPAKTIGHYRIAGFVIDSHHLVDFDGNQMHRVDSWIVPYWSICLPLTALSACLLLWPRRKRKTSAQTPNPNVNSN
jgi:hypothetical protein